jgi:hypothetical protein
MMKEIPLSRGLVALVDDEDYEELMKYKWSAMTSGYAHRATLISSKPRKFLTTSMHQYIMGLKHGDPRMVDHIDGNKRNNQRSNLRICTVSENGRNKKSTKNTSGYKGVTWDKERGKWMAQIKVNKKLVYLGRYDDPHVAHKAYCEAALKLHGEFARITL